MVEQVQTKVVTIQSIMRSVAFNVGFKEAQQGIPLDYDRYANDGKKQWEYERGRQFAMVYDGSVKNGKKLITRAIMNYHHAVMSKYVV